MEVLTLFPPFSSKLDSCAESRLQGVKLLVERATVQETEKGLSGPVHMLPCLIYHALQHL